MYVHEWRGVRRREIDGTFRVWQLFQFAAQVRLNVAANVLLMLGHIQPREVYEALRTGHVEPGELDDQTVVGDVSGKPHLTVVVDLRKVSRTDYCLFIDQSQLAFW